MNNLTKTLTDELEQKLAPPNNLREALRAADRPEPPKPQIITKTAVMTRLADAMHRIERVAETMEKIADEAERQIGIVKSRL